MSISQALHLGKKPADFTPVAKVMPSLDGLVFEDIKTPSAPPPANVVDSATPPSSSSIAPPKFPELFSDVRALVPKLGLDAKREELLRLKLHRARGDMSARLKSEYAAGAEAAAAELSEMRRQLHEAREEAARLRAARREARGSSERSSAVVDNGRFAKPTAASHHRTTLPSVQSTPSLPARAPNQPSDVDEAGQLRRGSSVAALDAHAEGRKSRISADSRVLRHTRSSLEYEHATHSRLLEGASNEDSAPSDAAGAASLGVRMERLPTLYGTGSASIAGSSSALRPPRGDPSAKAPWSGDVAFQKPPAPSKNLAEYIRSGNAGEGSSGASGARRRVPQGGNGGADDDRKARARARQKQQAERNREETAAARAREEKRLAEASAQRQIALQFVGGPTAAVNPYEVFRT